MSAGRSDQGRASAQRTEAESAVRVPFTTLANWTARVLECAGVPPAEAAKAALVLVRTDARGYPTHGVARLKSYLEKLRQGELVADARSDWTLREGVLTGRANRQLGQVAGPAAVARTAELAREQAIAVCILREAGHLGALGVLPLDAAADGLVTLICQAGAPLLSLRGGGLPLIGNNPFALVAPRRSGSPLVIDMSCGVVARGNLLLAARTGEPIPEGWAVDEAGRDTTDAAAALRGAMLPFGDYKGLVLAMMIGVLGGALTGSAFPPALNARTAAGPAVPSPAMILVMNPALLSGRESYEDYMEAWTRHVAEAGAGAARVPGERAAQDEEAARAAGVRLPQAIAEELRGIGRETGIPFA